MKKTSLFFLLIFSIVLFLQGRSNAQLTGTKTIPGDYANITAAITDLNTQGVGTGGVVFNVAAGYTETAVNVVLTCATNPPSVSRPVTFQKSGLGANPLLTAGVGVSTTTDGIFKLNGVNYVTIDGIDLQENVANTDATTQMEWGYALVKQSGTLACQFTTIKNCTVTLNKNNVNSVCIYTGNHLATSTTALTVSAFTGTASYNRFYNNTCQNSFTGMQIQGYSAATPFDLYDQGNEVGTVSGGRSQILNFGNGTSTSSAYGIRTINQNGLKIFNTNINSTGGADNNSTLNGIFLSTATNGSCEIYGDTVTLSSGATTSQMIGINCDMGATGNGNRISIHDNVVKDCLYPGATSGEFRGISLNTNASASYIDVYNNRVANNLIPGTGVFHGIGLTASSTNILAGNFYNNIVSNNTKTGTSGIMYLLFMSSSAQKLDVYNNQLINNSCASSSSNMYGYYNFGVGYYESIHDNQINNNTSGTGEFIAISAQSGSGPTNKDIYGNTISGHVGAGIVGAIMYNYATDINVYRNNIFNLTSNNTSGSMVVYGIRDSNQVNLNKTISNNFISDLKAPSNTSPQAIYGMYFNGVATGNNFYVYYNTIYLNAVSSSATTFGTVGIGFGNTSTSANLDLRNNIIVNVSTPGPTGGSTVVLQRRTTALTNYNISSGNNCLYAGTPSSNRLIYTDGTNNDQTLQNFKDRVTPREQASFTELPPFVNVSTAPYNLHIQTGVATQVEKGGQVVSVTTDYDGNTRGTPFPDAGADEFTGIFTDNASPLISYTALSNGDATSPRLFGNVLITDPSGINTTAGTKPRVYFKKSTNANTFNDNTNATDGWKYVEATNASSPFSFSINYALINGGVVAADVIQYFVTAQDLNATPRIGINAGAYTTQPATVNLGAANFPLTSTINQYTITAGTSISGIINVGSTETLTSLTNTGGAFAFINSSTLSGNVTLNITSDLTAELGTVALNQWSETGAGGYTVTLVSSAATIRTISGTTSSSGMIRLDGADRVRIDGRVGGSGQYLRIRNTATNGPSIHLLNDAQDNIIRNCIVEGASTTTALTTSGVINIASTTGLNGNDNNIITYNEIRDRSDATGFPAVGISCVGSSSNSLSQYNNNCTISNNNIHDYYLDGGTTQAGIFISAGNSGFNIDSNSVYQTVTRSITVTGTTITGILLSISSTVASNGGFNLRNNYIGGTAPQCGGTPLTYTTSSTTQLYGFRGIQLVTGQIPNSIQGNTIANFDCTVNAGASNFFWCGIAGGNGIHNIGTTTGNTIGSGTGNDNIKLTINGATGANIIRGISLGFFTSTAWGGNVENNTVGSFTIGGTLSSASGTTCDFISLGSSIGWVNNYSVSNNLVGSLTTPNSIRFTYPGGTNFRGMSFFTSNSVSATINNNKIQNITETGTNASSVFFSMLANAGTAAVNFTITNNTVSNLASAMTSASTNSLNGIYIITGGTSNVVSGNTVAALSLTNNAATNAGVVGLLTQTNNLNSGTVSKNRIYGLSNQLTGSAPALVGMWFINSADYTVSNNMISITNGETSLDRIISADNRVPVTNGDMTVKNVIPGYEVPAGYNPANEKHEADIPTETPSMNEFLISSAELEGRTQQQRSMNNKPDAKSDKKDDKSGNFTSEPNAFTSPLSIYGILDQSQNGTKTMNYNSIYIGGSNTGTALNSYCLYKIGTDITSLRNNLFYNNRSGSGVHFAIGNDATIPANGWLSSASDYNAFVTSDSTAIGSWAAINRSFDDWRTTSGGDLQSWYAKTTQVSPANLFTNVATGDLHINSSNSAAWLVSGKGIAVAGAGDDFDGNSRSTSISGGVSDIGADEFTATPPSNPVALQSAAPSSGGTTDYILFGRKIASITWGTGGTYPSSMNVNYFSGVSPLAPNVTNPARNSNSYWTVNPATGTFSGTTYDITFFYGDNETFSVTSPASNVLLAKNDNTFWMSYPRGTGSLQSEQAGTTVKVRGLFRFSSFTLTDAGLPAERPLTPVNNATNQPTSVTLVWNKSLLASTYRVQVATDSLFTSLFLNDSTVTDSTRLVTGLTAGSTNYWWRVNGKSGAGTGAWSQAYKFTTTAVLPPAVVNLSVIPGGFYDSGTGRLNMKDTIRVYLVDSASCLRVDSAKSTVDSVTFGANISFSNANTGNYYMLVYHRNHLAVATRYRAAITRGSTVSYDFTTDSTKAFGFNMIKVSNSPVRWAMIPGDANRDGFVDAIDQTIWIAQNGLDGYLPADFNGDLFVDAIDQAIWIIYNGTSSFLPCGFTFEAATDRVILNTPDYDAKKNSALIREKKKMLEPVKTDVKKDNNKR